MVNFIKGKKLSKMFFKEAVEPILDSDFPYLKYSAGLIGPGSDVLGLDTSRSMDHDWGPRLVLFLADENLGYEKSILEALGDKLPYSFKGFSTNFTSPDKKGIKVSSKISTGRINHGIKIYSINSFFSGYLNFDISNDITPEDWLVFSEQKLLTIRKSELFHDDLGLQRIVDKFNYYPQDVWLYLLASQWQRISQEEPFMGRCGELNDEIGSRIVATSLIKDLMKLSFLIEKEYSPYIKWLGTGFLQLRSGKKLAHYIRKILNSTDWKEREKYLTKIYEYLARAHNHLKITKKLPEKASYFHDRPFLVIHGDIFAKEIQLQITDTRLRKLPLMGSVNQFSDSTDLLEHDTSIFKNVYGIHKI